jgi:hypothetical protein
VKQQPWHLHYQPILLPGIGEVIGEFDTQHHAIVAAGFAYEATGHDMTVGPHETVGGTRWYYRPADVQ